VRIEPLKTGSDEGPFLTVATQEAVKVTRSVIDLGNGRVSIRLDNANACDCSLNPSMRVEPSTLGQGLEAIDEVLVGLSLESPLLCAVTGRDVAGRDRPDFTRSVIQARIAAVVDSIESAWLTRCIVPVLGAMKQAIGLGIGLTPSGDDFLIGFLGASYFFTHTDDFRKAVFESIRPLIHRTSLPSFFMLKAALRGLYPRPLTELFCALEYGRPAKIGQAVRRVTGIGATSGQDMLAGVLSWLHISATCGATDAAHCS
jgi:hypothetical protein